MKAARWYNARDIRVDEIAEPEVSAGRVKVKVAWTGICGSDLHEYIAGPIFIPVDNPHPITGDRAPIVMGHEFSGEVVEIGDNVTRVAVGDRVVIEPILSDGGPHAYIGKYNLTDKLGFHGLSGGGGGFSQYTVVDERMVHKMPDGLSYEQGALVEPAAVALHAVRQSKLKAGDKAVVFGAGPIGLLIIDALRAAGASEIYAVELSKPRAEKAMQLGARAVIDPSRKDPAAAIRELTKGGADVAFEVTGIPKVLQQCIDSPHFEGDIVVVSIWETEASFHPNSIVLKERSMRGIIAYRDVFPATMELMTRGYFSGDILITQQIPIQDIVSGGFETLTKEKQQVKILVEAPH